LSLASSSAGPKHPIAGGPDSEAIPAVAPTTAVPLSDPTTSPPIITPAPLAPTRTRTIPPNVITPSPTNQTTTPPPATSTPAPLPLCLDRDFQLSVTADNSSGEPVQVRMTVTNTGPACINQGVAGDDYCQSATATGPSGSTSQTVWDSEATPTSSGPDACPSTILLVPLPTGWSLTLATLTWNKDLCTNSNAGSDPNLNCPDTPVGSGDYTITGTYGTFTNSTSVTIT